MKIVIHASSLYFSCSAHKDLARIDFPCGKINKGGNRSKVQYLKSYQDAISDAVEALLSWN